MYIPEQRDGLINILMAEDSEADAMLARRSFKKATLKTNFFIVDDGKEAIDFVHHREGFEDINKYPRPDVILLDINMPRLSGLQVLEYLKNDEQTKDLPCVFLTSSKNEEDIIKGYGLGCSSYIPKPVDYLDFKRVIECFNFYWVAMNSKPPYVSQEALDTNILIVDDEDSDANFMMAALAKNGYHNLSFVKTGEEALEKVQSEQSEIIIIDIHLPGMDGVEVCRRIKNLDGVERKVILITGDDDCVEVIRDGECGAVDYLVKSSDYSNLLQALRGLVK